MFDTDTDPDAPIISDAEREALDAADAEAQEQRNAEGAEALEDETFDPEAIRFAVESEEVTDLPTDEDRRTLYRVLRRRQRIEMEMTRIADQVGAMLKRMGKEIEGIDFVYAPLLADITRKLLRAQGGKKKSISTPFGVAGFRSTKGKLTVEDEGKLILYIDGQKDNAELQACIKREPKLIKGALNDLYAKSGELLPGEGWIGAGEKFYIK